jgi:hypothetical protein
MAGVLALLLQVDVPTGQVGAAMFVMTGACVGAVTYVAAQRLLGSPEAAGLLGLLRRRTP